MKNSRKRSLLATAAIAVFIFTAEAAFAQTSAPPASPPPAAAAPQEIVVTGSRIPQPNLTTTSPVTQITGADIALQGATRVEDLINQLPQAFAAQNATVSNAATGAATVDLRGLGAERTLVLIDGRRLPYGSPNAAAADINQIPSQLVDRVEVLTGGASAVYGSDAVAGVVNFIMRDDFEGVEVDAQYGYFQHNNDYDGPGDLRRAITERGRLNPNEFQLPDDNVIDGYSKELSVALGIGTPDGRGNITAYASYRNNDAVLQRDRDYSACSIGAIGSAGATQFTCGGSSTNATGRFTSLANDADLTLGPNSQFIDFSSARDLYNFGPTNYYQRPDERYSLGAFGRYEINPSAEVFTQLMFTDYSTIAQIAPSGSFYGGGPSANGGFIIGCDNPLLSAQQRAAIGCGAGVTSAEVLIGRRNVEGGGRQDDIRYQTWRAVLGLRGAITEGWDYEVAAQYSKTDLSRTYRNDFSTQRIGRALDVVTNPATGEPACRSAIDPDGPTGPLAPSDPACVPYNIFTAGGVTPAALRYLQTPGLQNGQTTQQVVTGVITGDLGELGFRSPLSDEAVAVAFGVEYRADRLEALSDVAFETGDLAGQGGATPSVSGDIDTTDIFGEIRAPLVQGRPFADLISLNASYRYSNYSAGFNTNTYGVGADWAPIPALRLRGSYQRSVRAPNVLELFSPQGTDLFDADLDPCGPNRTATLAQCVATGVPASSYGSALLDSPAGQYNFLEGGNADLQAEEADTYTIGFVWTPTLPFLDGFNISIDYFDIDLSNRIDVIDPLVTLSQCYEENDPSACARVNRSALGTLWTQGGFVEALNTNIGGLKTSGVDLNVNYRRDLADFGLNWGTATLNVVGTYLNELETDPGVGPSAVFDCVGFYGNACETPNPEWRHRFRLGLETPIGLDLSATWRYYGVAELFEPSATNRPDFKFDPQSYLDLALQYQVREKTRIRLGINNVLDNDPPLSASVGTTGNGNTYPQTYDALGRFFFGGVNVAF